MHEITVDVRRTGCGFSDERSWLLASRVHTATTPVPAFNYTSIALISHTAGSLRDASGHKRLSEVRHQAFGH